LNCYYCDLIAAADSGYAPRPAEFDLGSEAPRCAWHWRYVCDHCGEPGHFMGRFYCPTSRRLLCREAGAVEFQEGPFWAWQYWWTLTCPDCGERHPSMDRAEFEGGHPWQQQPAAAEARRWLSSEPYLSRYPPAQRGRVPLESVTDAAVGASWSANAETWLAGYDERGDHTRKYQSDPVLFEFLGEVRGLRILDAGSGGGYLSRLPARRGARMVAVENARAMHEAAVAAQTREPLEIEFHHASISAMPFLDDACMDAAIANYVLMDVRDYEGAIAEIARVLRPGGSFVAVISPSSFEARWHTPAADSPRREDRAGWMDDDYFVRRAGYTQWGDLKPLLTFHRPLRDYIAACKGAGLQLRDLEEPEISEEARREWHAAVIRHHARVSWAYVLKFVKVDL
jgi:SAM-dependent methyltransferase